jgi:hypothetical protein
MKTLQITDEAYEALKTFIIDPFDDSPEKVIVRLMDIVNKARQRWSPFDPDEEEDQNIANNTHHGTRIRESSMDDSTVML